jgi:[ribosomal protein S18]-alanine N-acetyltransferase
MLEVEREVPASANWSHVHYESLFRTAPSELSQYLVLVVEDSSKAEGATGSASFCPIVAYMAAHCVDSDWELQYVVVAKEFRRRGVGGYLLDEFISYVRAKGGIRIFLEVRESNHSARALYRKMGFEETGLRKSYYSHPPEDAILCTLRLY